MLESNRCSHYDTMSVSCKMKIVPDKKYTQIKVCFKRESNEDEQLKNLFQNIFKEGSRSFNLIINKIFIKQRIR